MSKKDRPSPGPCGCGCGGAISQPPGAGRPRKYIAGHAPTRFPKEKKCECGCGQNVERKNTRGRFPKFIEGHPIALPKMTTCHQVVE